MELITTSTTVVWNLIVRETTVRAIRISTQATHPMTLPSLLMQFNTPEGQVTNKNTTSKN